MKKGWEYKKLGEVATFARGLTYSKNDEVEQSNNIVLRSNNIDLIAGKLDFSELKYLKEDLVIPDDKRLQKGSLFICMSNGSKAHLGKVAYVDKDYGYAFGGFMGQITPKNTVDGLYLHYALSSPFYKDYIKSLSEGANINNLKFKDLSEFIINYPPLSEQQSIVDYLDSVFAKIDAMKANAEKALNEAKALFQASLKEMLEPKEGWEEKTLKDVSIIYGNYGLSVPSTEYNGVRYLRITDITEWGDLNDEKVSAKFDEEKGQELLEEGDILFARTGATVGKTLMYKEAFGKCLFAGYLIRYRLNKEMILPKYMFYVTHSDNYYKWVLENQKAAAQPNISAKLYNEYIVLYPSISEQQSIVAALDSLKSKVDRLQENYNKISQECDALKQAILRQVFE
jgi:type I restriction enzyme S subunit